MTAVSTTLLPSSYIGDDKGKVGDGGIMLYSRMSFIPPITIHITNKDNIEVIFTTDIGKVSGLVRDYSGIAIIQLNADTSKDTGMNINISNLPTGTYTFTIVTEQGSIVKSEKFTVD
ncbi:hypothetical protein [Dysgonomonas sp. GY617]|uniref:hypothetical protein n=1 Tax=Dysgonomonas sp. GY617 TaxID=2780420 RepID=UPI0018836B45|nr:hypothetical protein [Dysgonomonas sp. GY617]MBF0577404.1 hypothetical protein [Dysgonomonas sp. GY617]